MGDLSPLHQDPAARALLRATREPARRAGVGAAVLGMMVGGFQLGALVGGGVPLLLDAALPAWARLAPLLLVGLTVAGLAAAGLALRFADALEDPDDVRTLSRALHVQRAAWLLAATCALPAGVCLVALVAARAVA